MKKTTNIKYYKQALFIAILFTGFACSDKFFDEQAGEKINPDVHYKSVIDLQNSMAGALAPLQVAMPKLIMLDGLRSDQMNVTSRADGYLNAINNQSFTVDNPYLDASDYYKVIINTNEILAHIDEVALVDRELNSYLLHYAKGAVIGLRSWSYLNLVRLYGKAAIIPDNLTSLPENLNQKYLTKEIMIDTLINQIKPYIYDNNAETQFVEYSFGGYPNTKALLGELYLEKGDYVNAASYLQKALESQGNSTSLFKVNNAYLNEGWKSIFMNGEGAYLENIAYIPFNFNEGQPNPLAKWMLYSDMYMVKPANALVDSFKTQVQLNGKVGDLARGLNVTYSLSATDEPYITKYALNKGELYGSDIVISRAADLHLMLAEALNRSGESKKALIILNSGFNAESVRPQEFFQWSSNIGIRGRAYLVPRNVNDRESGTKLVEMVEDLIMVERSMELAFEGKRWFDLVRVAKRRGPAYLADKISSKFSDPAKSAQIKALLMNEANWYLPLKK